MSVTVGVRVCLKDKEGRRARGALGAPRHFPVDFADPSGAEWSVRRRQERRQLEVRSPQKEVKSCVFQVMEWTTRFSGPCTALLFRVTHMGGGGEGGEEREAERDEERGFSFKKWVHAADTGWTPENHRMGWDNKEPHHQFSEWICLSVPFISLRLFVFSPSPPLLISLSLCH